MLCESISNLVTGVDGKDFDEAFSNMSAKVMVLHVDVLGPRTQLGQLG
jgi:hypothetical protein